MNNQVVLEGMVNNHKKILKQNNGKKDNLLKILKQALLENNPKYYFLAMDSRINQGNLDGVFEEVGVKVALTNKAIITTQRALRGIYNIARKKGYTEIVEIIEKEYPM